MTDMSCKDNLKLLYKGKSEITSSEDEGVYFEHNTNKTLYFKICYFTP